MYSLILIILAGVINALMDQSSINNLWNKWWNKGESWKLKWKLDSNGNLIPQNERLWYYLWVLTPKWKESFIYSSTLFVWLTDGWHLLQMLFLNIIILSIIVFNPINLFFDNNICQMIINFLILRIGYGVGFNTMYYSIK